MSLSAVEPYSGFLTVSGALIIFFSWVVNNAIQERFKEAAASATGLRVSFELFEALRELAGSIESVASIALNVSRDVTGVIEMLRPSRDGVEQHNRELMELAGSRLNARQVDAGITFCELALRAAGGRSSDTQGLQRVLGRLRDAKARKDEMFTIADEALKSHDDWRSSLSSLPTLLDEYAVLLRRSVEHVNDLLDSRAAEVDRLRRKAIWARRAGLTLYAVGSLLAIAGTAASEL